MRLSLHQRVSARGTFHIWVGASGVTQPPAISWTIDGAPANPGAVVQMTSVRTAAMVAPNQLRAFAGIVSFVDPDPTRPHRLEAVAQLDGTRALLDVRSIPSAVPNAGPADAPLRILLASCFHRDTDKNRAGTIVHQIVKSERPDLTLFLGDQVYLDLPTLQNFKNTLPWMAANFESKYVENWFPDEAAFHAGYHELLSSAPSVFAPDDHEYWNNFPHAAPHLENTFTGGGRANWTQAAQQMWRAFQMQSGKAPGEAVVIDDIDPLSILVLDTRTDRTRGFDDPKFMSQAAIDATRQWSRNLIARKRFGFLITGQTLFEPPAGFFAKRFGDARMADHKSDYAAVIGAIRQAVSAGRPILCITGDVHWGRVLAARGTATDRLFEIISSPVSLVQNLLKDVGGATGQGQGDDWPKHTKPPTEDVHFAEIGTFELHPTALQRGNQVVLLELRRKGTAIEIKVRFHPIHPTKNLPVTTAELTLR